VDIHQLRSWILELYEPLEDQRQYIVFDAARGNLLIDVPPFSERALRLIRGTGRASLLFVTNAIRAAEASRYRDELGVQIAAHADDVGAVAGGADLVLGDDEMLRPDARVLRVSGEGPGPSGRVAGPSGRSEGASVVLLRKAGGVLVCGDLDLSSPAARPLLAIDFSVVLSANRAPMWNAGRDALRELQHELPKPRKRFGILLPPPWDRLYAGRLEDKMYPHERIVPEEETAAHEAGMGPTTLVVSRTTPDKQARAPRPLPDARS